MNAAAWALAAVALLEACALMGAARAIQALERRHARRVDTLLDRLAHAHGRTWTPPPADEPPEEPTPEYEFGVERDPGLLT